MKVKMKGTIDIDWMEVPEEMAKKLKKIFNEKTKPKGLSIDVEVEHELYDEDK